MQTFQNWSLARKVNTVLSVTVSLIFLVFALIAISQIRTEILAMQRDSLEKSSLDLQKITEWWLERLHKDLELRASDKGLAAALSEGELTALSDLMRNIKSNDMTLENVSLLDSRGAVVASSHSGRDGEVKRYWPEIQSTGSVVTDPYAQKDSQSGHAVFEIAAPIRDA